MRKGKYSLFSARFRENEQGNQRALVINLPSHHPLCSHSTLPSSANAIFCRGKTSGEVTLEGWGGFCLSLWALMTGHCQIDWLEFCDLSSGCLINICNHLPFRVLDGSSPAPLPRPLPLSHLTSFGNINHGECKAANWTQHHEYSFLTTLG